MVSWRFVEFEGVELRKDLDWVSTAFVGLGCLTTHVCGRHISCHSSPATPTAPVPFRIDVFAVRQWPGNGADLDFRGVLAGCTAAIVAAAPIEGTLTSADD